MGPRKGPYTKEAAMREKFPGHEGGSMGNDTRSVETGDAPLSVSAPVFADERAPGSMAKGIRVYHCHVRL